MPQGAEFLAPFAAFVIAAFVPLLRDLTLPILFKCPGAALLFVGGAFIYQVNERVDLFIVAIAGGLAIILLALPDLFPRLAQPVGGGTLATVFASSRLRLGVTVGAIVLYLAFLAYPLIRDNIPGGSDDADNAPDWSVLALPAYYSGGDRSREQNLKFQWKLFSTTQTLLRLILQPLGEKLKLEPRLQDRQAFGSFSEKFSVPEGNLSILREELRKRGSANCEDARLLLHAEYQENNEGGEERARIGVILYTFLECKSSDAADNLPRLSLVHRSPFRSVFRGEQFDIFALKVSVPIVRHLIGALNWPKPEADAVWKKITQSFQERYNDFEEISMEHEEGWRGHELGKDGDCANVSGPNCAQAWKEAYEDIYRHKAEQLQDALIPGASVAWLLIKTTESGKQTE